MDVMTLIADCLGHEVLRVRVGFQNLRQGRYRDVFLRPWELIKRRSRCNDYGSLTLLGKTEIKRVQDSVIGRIAKLFDIHRMRFMTAFF